MSKQSIKSNKNTHFYLLEWLLEMVSLILSVLWLFLLPICAFCRLYLCCVVVICALAAHVYSHHVEDKRSICLSKLCSVDDCLCSLSFPCWHGWVSGLWLRHFWSFLLIWATTWDFQQWYVRPAKAQTSLRICAVWSEPLLVPWIFYEY